MQHVRHALSIVPIRSRALALLFLASICPRTAHAQDPAHSTDLEKTVQDLQKQIQAERQEREAREQALLDALAHVGETKAGATSEKHWYDRFTFGGYGEIHYHNTAGSGGSEIDLARIVGYVGYRFADWIQFDSEIEIEDALVAEDGDGELSVEQAHFDFAFSDAFNVRAGRFLTPLGIVNETHEPTTFNGVERPLFDTVVIPTTWFADGVGIFGRATPELKYELYLQSSLDGTGFDTVEGLRETRQEGSPGLGEPGVSGRLDWYPSLSGSQSLRLGVSSFAGGMNNGEHGENPGVDASLAMYSADFQYSVSRFDFRGAYAYGMIHGASSLPAGTASAIDGYMIEGAVHVMPDAWKSGKLERSDAVVFARYDAADTQKDMPDGVAADPHGKQDEITLGVSFFPVPDLVLKADFQIRDDDSDEGLPERVNVGIGWRF